MSSNKIGNTGAFDNFFPLLSDSQRDEIDKFRNDYATRVDNRRMASPDSEIRAIMGTMEREKTPVSERSLSALSRALKSPQAQEITRQQRREKRRENELQALRKESEEEFRSASSASSGSSGSSRSKPRLLPFTCIWCGKNIFDYASPNEKINRLHKVCDTNYQFFFNRYYPGKPISYNEKIIKEVKNKFNQEKAIQDYNLLLKEKEIGWEKNKLDRLLENPEETNNSDRDKLFPLENLRLSGVPVSGVPVFQTTEGEVKEFLDGQGDDRPDRYSTYNSKVAQEIQAREELEARKEKHKEIIAEKNKNKNKCEKNRCIITGGKKRRKTKKRRRKKRKTKKRRKNKRKTKKRRKTKRRKTKRRKK